MPDLCDIADVREYMGLEGSANEALLKRLITAVSKEIESFCGQPLVREANNVTHTFVGVDRTHQLLPYFPVSGVGVLSYLTTIGEDPTVVDVATYQLTAAGPLYYIHSGGFIGGYPYTVLLTVGHEAPPADVSQVAIEMTAARAWDSAGRESGNVVGKQRLGKSSESTAVGGATHSTVFQRPDWAARLAPYRVVSV